MSLSIIAVSEDQLRSFNERFIDIDAHNVPLQYLHTLLGLGYELTWTGGSVDAKVLSDGNWIDVVVEDPVDFAKHNGVVSWVGATIKLLGDSTSEGGASTTETPWFLNRIRNRYQPWIVNPIKADVNFHRPVEIYVVDSGINADHPVLQGCKVTNFAKISKFDDFVDRRGHGTSIAGLLYDSTYGLGLSNVEIRSVKVYEQDTKITVGELVEALDEIVDYHKNNSPDVIRVVNMSWATIRDPYLDDKIQQMLSAGLVVVGAAGNTPIDISMVTPAGIPGVIVVAGSTENDEEYVSVYGSGRRINLYAPANNITVIDIQGGVKVSSGSSYAAALTSGVLAIITQLFSTKPTTTQLVAALTRDSTPSALTVNNSVSIMENKLLHDPRYAAAAETTAFFYGLVPIGTSTVINTTAATRFNGFQKSFDELEISVTFPDVNQRDLYSNYVMVDSQGTVTVSLPNGFTIPTELDTVCVVLEGRMDGIVISSPKIFFFVGAADTTEQQVQQSIESLKQQKVYGGDSITQYIGIALLNMKRK